MKKPISILLSFLIVICFLTGCALEPWVDMVDALMAGNYDKANKQYARMSKDPVKIAKSSEYIYSYIDNILSSYANETSTYDSLVRKYNHFSNFDMPLYNLEENLEKATEIHQCRELFEKGRELYLNESYIDAYKVLEQVEDYDEKYFAKAQEYMLSTAYVLILNERYVDASQVLMAVDINMDTLSMLSDYTVETVIRLLYYKNDIESVYTLNENLLKKISLLNENISIELKDWANQMDTVYYEPENAAIILSLLPNDTENIFFRLNKVQQYLDNSQTDYAFIVLKSIPLDQQTIGHVANYMTTMLSQYLYHGNAEQAQKVIDTIFKDIDNAEMVTSMTAYITENIENQDYLSEISMIIR